MRRLTLLALAAATVVATPAHAFNATCFTDDDGRYPCSFRQFGGDGSFTISAPGRPTYTVSIFAPGVADAFADFGGGNVALPGPHVRSNSDRACWVSQATGASICAY